MDKIDAVAIRISRWLAAVDTFVVHIPPSRNHAAVFALACRNLTQLHLHEYIRSTAFGIWKHERETL